MSALFALLSLLFVWCLCIVLISFIKNTARFQRLSTYYDIAVSSSPLSISGWTSRFTHTIFRFGGGNKHRLQRCYGGGVVLACVGMVVSLLLLSVSLIQSLSAAVHPVELEMEASSYPSLPTIKFDIAIPGLNMPLSQIGYLWVAIMISVSFHEFGHALAAASHGIRTKAIGFFVAVFFPGAWVELDDDDLQSLTPVQRLKISAAGVWHNALLCIMCLLVILCVPWLASPCFGQGHGISVVQVADDFSLSGLVRPGDIIDHIDHTPITSVDQWHSVLEAAMSPPSLPGYCVPAAAIQANFVHGTSCCDVDSSSPSPHTCFSTIPNMVPSSNRHHYNEQTLDSASSHASYTRICMSAREHILSPSVSRCSASQACAHPTSEVCVQPVLENEYIRVLGLGMADERRFLFAGDPRELVAGIRASDYVPRAWFTTVVQWLAPRFLHFSLFHWPDMLLHLLRFVIAVSASLALLNSAPIHYADGSWTVHLLHEWWYTRQPGFKRCNSDVELAAVHDASTSSHASPLRVSHAHNGDKSNHSGSCHSRSVSGSPSAPAVLIDDAAPKDSPLQRAAIALPHQTLVSRVLQLGSLLLIGNVMVSFYRMSTGVSF